MPLSKSLGSFGWVERLRQAVQAPADAEIRFGQIAVTRGYLLPTQLDACVREQEERGRRGDPISLDRLLLEKRYLTIAQMREVERVQAGTPIQVGKYRILREVGRGGMGIVFEAEDPELGRRVALKIIREEEASDGVIERLHREAAIAAGLSHPNIVPIHEVGMVRDESGRSVHFIALEFVEGRTFADVLQDPHVSRKERLRMLRDVAGAAAYAHSRGVVHRDLKPGNVLVDRAGRVLLADFGLARGECFPTKLTKSFALMGTPQYMAPEQVEGKTRDIDARTDVYALGVMMYEILVGRPPFDAPAMSDLAFQILGTEPARPGRLVPGLEDDLEVICLRALEKERDRRYPSAEALADDLRRFAAGEPIVARRPSVWYRAKKILAKRRGIVWTAAGSLAFACVGATVLLLRLALAEKQARESRELALRQLRSRTSIALQAALELKRTGNLEATAWLGRDTEEACREAIRELEDSPEPHYRLGRMYRALLREEEALREQERALTKNPRYASARYERVVLVARRARQRRMGLVHQAWREEGLRLSKDGEKKIPADASIRKPTLAALLRRDPEWGKDLEQLRADLEFLASSTFALEPGQVECARGLRAWSEGDLEKARAFLREAVGRTPTLEEGYEALATIEWEDGNPEESIRWWTEGWSRDRGHIRHLEGRGLVYGMQAWMLASLGQDPDCSYVKAAEDFTQILNQAPGHREAWIHRGRLRIGWGLSRETRGQDPKDLYRLAIDDLTEAIRREPGAALGWMGRAEALHLLARHLHRRGLEIAEPCAAALGDLEVASGLAPEDPGIVLQRAYVRSLLGTHRWSEGEDPRSELEEALVEVERSLALDPGSSEAWLLRGSIVGDCGLYLVGVGLDPTAQYAASIDDLGKSLELNIDGSRFAALLKRAGVRMNWGDFRAGKRMDPTEQFSSAVRDLEEALRENSTIDDAWLLQGQVHLMRGNHELRAGRDPTPEYSVALKAVCRALELNRSHDQTWVVRAMIHTNLGGYARTVGGDPEPWFEAARGDFDEAVRVNPANGLTWRQRGQVLQIWGDHRSSRGDSADGHYREALRSFEEAVRLRPAWEEELRGTTEHCRALSKFP